MADSDSDYEPEYEPETVQVGDLSLSVMTLVPPPIEYMSVLHDKKEEISGRKVWCGSQLLAKYILESAMGSVRGMSVLELGAGTGIVGMTLAKLNECGVVAMTDGDEEALELLRKNVAMNGLEESDNVGVTNYLWGDDKGRIDSFKLWCRSTFPGTFPETISDIKFEVLIAGDVLYKDGLPELFFESVQNLMRSDGVLYLCHVPRHKVTHDVVMDKAAAASFDIERVDTFNFEGDSIELPDGCPLEDALRGRVYRVTRKK